MKEPEEPFMKVVVPIIQGLLSSGHYTKLDEDEFPFAIQKMDKDEKCWKYSAITDAIEIAHELIDAAKHEIKLREEMAEDEERLQNSREEAKIRLERECESD